jgi:Dyp-type peroxidase family
MPIDLQLTAIDVDPASVNYAGDDYQALLKDTQGNILKPHGRDFSTLVFLQFNTSNVNGVEQWIARQLAPLVTSGWAQMQESKLFRTSGQSGVVFVNAALSADGYRALGVDPAGVPGDPSFLRGMKNPDPKAALGLNDPPVSQWQSGLQQALHMLISVADDSQAAVDAMVAQITGTLGGIATVVNQENGAVFRNGQGQVIEHFGFVDGVSQPVFFADDIEKQRMNGGIDVYDPSAALGLALLKDPLGGPMGYGSYLVFRKLPQDVAGFRANEARLATALKLPPEQAELAGAYVVGRFRDGTPVGQQPVAGWTNEPNNFNYDHDADGMRCPFQAHIRKTNPRGDKVREFGLPAGEDRSRRIARRAVSYGPLTLSPPAGSAVGLLFMCVQSSVVNQFEFMQAIWSNFTNFLRPATGLDPVIGQAAPGAASVPQNWPATWGVHASGAVSCNFSAWVGMQGGEYFFLPSLGFLQSLGSPASKR